MNKVKNIISEMATFIKICNDYLRDLSKIDKILKKDYYTQFETILISTDQDSFINSLSLPTLIPPDQISFELIPSTFPEFLNHYNKLAVVGDQKLYYWINEKKKYSNDKIDGQARLLYVSSDTIMITVGKSETSSKAFEFNTSNLSFKELPPLNFPRYNHGMGWIEGYPAVISGKIDNLNVEIFKGKNWHNHFEVKISRNSFACCNIKDRVFIYGGLNKDGIIEESAEMWDNNAWITLPIVLPFYNTWTGINFVGSRILFLGGKNKSDLLMNSVFSIDYNLSKIQKEHHMISKEGFDMSSWRRVSDRIVSFNYLGVKVEYSIIISF